MTCLVESLIDAVSTPCLQICLQRIFWSLVKQASLQIGPVPLGLCMKTCLQKNSAPLKACVKACLQKGFYTPWGLREGMPTERPCTPGPCNPSGLHQGMPAERHCTPGVCFKVYLKKGPALLAACIKECLQKGTALLGPVGIISRSWSIPSA